MVMEELEPEMKVQCRNHVWEVKYKNPQPNTVALHKPKPAKDIPAFITVSLAEVSNHKG